MVTIPGPGFNQYKESKKSIWSKDAYRANNCVCFFVCTLPTVVPPLFKSLCHLFVGKLTNQQKKKKKPETKHFLLFLLHVKIRISDNSDEYYWCLQFIRGHIRIDAILNIFNWTKHANKIIKVTTKKWIIINEKKKKSAKKPNKSNRIHAVTLIYRRA